MMHGFRTRHLVLACALAAATVMSVVSMQPASAGSGTLYGAVVAKRGTEGFDQALSRQDAAYSRMPISRVFYTGAPQAWPGNAGLSGRPVVVSFSYNPADVLLGTYDAAITKWFKTAPTTYDVYWAYIHEPEDNIERGEFTATQYRDALTRVAGLAAKANNPHLRPTLILMCWTLGPDSGRDWHNYYPGPGVVRYAAFDCYNYFGRTGSYVAPDQLFARVLDFGTSTGIPWGIAEVGSVTTAADTTGTGRAAWLRSVGHFLAGKALFVNYFDVKLSVDYRLLDSASQSAWKEVVTTY
jgi:hypothetical protein